MNYTSLRRALVLTAVLGLLVAACSSGGSTGTAGPGAADPALAEIKIDYATYSPPSLVLKKMGWAEEAFKGTSVKSFWRGERWHHISVGRNQ